MWKDICSVEKEFYALSLPIGDGVKLCFGWITGSREVPCGWITGSGLRNGKRVQVPKPSGHSLTH
ncbi:hypothetical protein HanXRQr2_Chr10g0428191 [Helianthus annuus]|uniref:Uncharacterized protein n=1 Tax=Helianthus annuus TaxID=4232 RepID=A0A9K3HVQ3_HELAN|nr:hypothetical protein HanXRQr2_Chr10g0428191 [Helianthus annuus]